MENNQAGSSVEPKTRTVFQCSECWYRCRELRNQCGSCGTFNSLEPKEITLGSHTLEAKGEDPSSIPTYSPLGGMGIGMQGPMRLADLARTVKEPVRISTGYADVDHAFGTNDINGECGAVPGTAIVIGGDPGVGKSTLLTQIIGKLAERGPVFYGSGEESAEAVALRSNRLRIFNSPKAEENFICHYSRDTLYAANWIRQYKPVAAIIDSAQVFTAANIDSPAKSVKQVENNAMVFQAAAAASGTIVLIVCHITKGGNFAGPKAMEHFVDATFLMKHHSPGKVLLAPVKNRYGDIQAAGLLNMTANGLTSASG